MSDMEMKATKFEVVERFQEAKKTVAVMELKLRTIGTTLKGMGMDLETSGRLSGVHPRIDLHQVASLLEDHAAAMQTLARARAEMESIGMQGF